MASYDIRPLQLRILDILLAFDQLCKEHHIRYYILAGTQLGAVRHQGFIPWDDDADIGVPRADYERLIANISQQLPSPYEFLCGENNPEYPFPYAKIQDASTSMIERKEDAFFGGIYLDVFPLDGVPEGKMAQRIQFLKYRYARKILHFTYRDPYKHGKGVNALIPLLCHRFFTIESAQQLVRKVLTRYDFDASSLVADYDDRSRSMILEKSIFGEPTPILFEGKTVYGVAKPDIYLTRKYGNYKQIPDPKKQKQHNFYLLELNKPYREYQDYIRPLQLRLLNILTTFDQVCRERGLRYYLMAGTLLGAVRHQGFIPWDDDIDVGMPRADYNLLIAHAQEWLPQNYEMVCAENTPAYPFPFAKMQDAETTFIERRGFKHVGGIYVDVFPLDGVPSGKIARKRQFFQYKFWTKILYFTCRDPHKHGHDTSSLIPLLCRKLFTPAAIQKRIRKILTRYSFDQSVLIADYDDGIKGVMDKKILGNATPLSFEGKQLLGIEKYDEYLTQKYGDYMQIPEQGKQRQHGFYYLSLGKPYREYKGKG